MRYEGRDPSLANISELAAMFGKGRSTVRASIEKSCIKVGGKEKGNNLFKIAEVAQVLYGSASYDEAGEIDPATLKPSERKDYWIAQQKEMDFKIQIREYVPAQDVRRDYKQLQDSLKQKIQSYPDILERDEGATPKEIERIILLCDRLQRSLSDAWNE